MSGSLCSRETEVDVAATQAEIEKLEKELTTVRRQMDEHLRELGLTWH